MRKRHHLIVLFFLLLVSLLLFLLAPNIFPKSESKLHPDQQKVIDLMGYPEQFVITYAESGSDDNPQLIRNEIWIYSKSATKVTFLGGKLAYSEEYNIGKEVTASKYRPEDFEFDQDSGDVAKIVGDSNLYEVQDLPGVTDTPGIKVYTTEDMMFIIENGYLTYAQTLIPGEEVK